MSDDRKHRSEELTIRGPLGPPLRVDPTPAQLRRLIDAGLFVPEDPAAMEVALRAAEQATGEGG
jgi:hypothetical protein